MDIDEYTAYDADDTLFPSDMWAEIFDDTIGSDPEAIHLFAEMMLRVKQAIESGPDGAIRATNTLMGPDSRAVRLLRNLQGGAASLDSLTGGKDYSRERPRDRHSGGD